MARERERTKPIIIKEEGQPVNRQTSVSPERLSAVKGTALICKYMMMQGKSQ